MLGGGDDRFGERGGGGGAGGSVRFVDLPAAAAPAPAPAPKAEVVQPPEHVVPPPQLDPAPTLTAPVIAPPAAVVASTTPAVGANGDGSAGQGPGTGGGTGSGTGTGTGNDSGPGRGGNGGYILPSTRVLIFPPDCAHGRFRVEFSISAEGRVTRVGVDPEPQDAGCRRQMLDKMKQYEFSPATRDGRAIAATIEVTVQH